MSPSRMTFGEHLRQFALSIDFIDATYYDLVQQHIKEYLKLQLGAVQVGFFERTKVDDQDGMTTVWSYPTFRVYQSLKNPQGEYRRQLALTLGEDRSLWVVSPDKERLSPSNRGIDYWQEGHPSPDLPPFNISPGGSPSRTAIIMTTRDATGRSNGAFLIEIANPVRPTQALRREMQLLAESVGLLHATDVSTREQREGTNMAIARLGDLVRQLELDTGPRPLLFVASSHRAKEDVMDALSEVLDEFESYVYVQHWGEIHHPGNINLQLVEKIKKAQYGICYLSELVEESAADGVAGPRFRDNSNVLVEAGMLHMVTSSATDAVTGWIPVREEDSPDLPFDLENQRRVIVARDASGAMKKQEFIRDLRAKLMSLLEIDSLELKADG
jgi:hypothetical protein